MISRLHHLVWIGVLALAGCAGTPPGPDLAPQQGRASAELDPVWGVGERLKDHHRALWNNEARTYDYWVRGVLHAQYDPWEKVLLVRTDEPSRDSLTCRWDELATLQVDAPGTDPPAASEDRCQELLRELDRRMNRGV